MGEKLINHSPDSSQFTSFPRVLPNSRQALYCAGKPTESVVYCLNLIYTCNSQETQSVIGPRRPLLKRYALEKNIAIEK